MQQILIATHNPAKLKELKYGLKNLINKNINLVSLKELNINKEPEETGKTFCDNSLLKAQYYGTLTHLPTIADDGGLEIEILNGEPGVKSKRWIGHEGTDNELIEYTLNRLQGIGKQNRTAYLQTCIYFYDPKTTILFYETEKIYGYIAEKPSGRPTEGYPFRALFIVNKFNKFYDELTQKEHQQINHRLKALRRLTKRFKNLL